MIDLAVGIVIIVVFSILLGLALRGYAGASRRISESQKQMFKKANALIDADDCPHEIKEMVFAMCEAAGSWKTPWKFAFSRRHTEKDQKFNEINKLIRDLRPPLSKLFMEIILHSLRIVVLRNMVCTLIIWARLLLYMFVSLKTPREEGAREIVDLVTRHKRNSNNSVAA